MTRSSDDRAATKLLPAGLMDVLPPQAAFEAETVERLMRVVSGYGYERVKPPLLEFQETLLAGSGSALAKQTFQLMDPVSQRMLALRPDMTMQVARIAATRLQHRPRPLRLGYAGQVVRVSGSQLRSERQFGQVGAEIVGAAPPAADVEVILMAVDALTEVGIVGLSVDLGLPPLVPAILAECELDPAARARLAVAIDRKDVAAVGALGPVLGGAPASLLATLMASSGALDTAVDSLAAAELPIPAATLRRQLLSVIDRLRMAEPELLLTLDVVESRSFEYHTGVSFSLFALGGAGELGRGGRYRTGAGEDATGVTLFMDTLVRALSCPAPRRRLFLPAGTPVAAARRLRAEGWITIADVGGAAGPVAEAQRLECSHILLADEVRELTTGLRITTPQGC
jgi:ATP phosphoribosyltransferase regulatory subunit